MVVFQPTSGIQQHLVLLSPGLCEVVTRATTDSEVLVPGGTQPFCRPSTAARQGQQQGQSRQQLGQPQQQQGRGGIKQERSQKLFQQE